VVGWSRGGGSVLGEEEGLDKGGYWVVMVDDGVVY
jgi:hypothetical protein